MDLLSIIKTGIETFVGLSFGGITAIAVVKYLSKKLLDGWLQKKIDYYKNELNKDYEKYKTDIQLLAKENELRFSKLHNDRVEVIKNIYSKIVDVELNLFTLVRILRNESPDKPDWMNLITKTDQSFHDLQYYYTQNRIYFTADDCSLFSDICTLIIELFDIKIFTDYIQDKKKIEDEWFEKADKLINSEIPKLQFRIENIFRNILGVV